MTAPSGREPDAGCAFAFLGLLNLAAVGSLVGAYACWVLAKQAGGGELWCWRIGTVVCIVSAAVYAVLHIHAEGFAIVWLFRISQVGSILAVVACWLLARQSQGWASWAWGAGIGLNALGVLLANMIQEGQEERERRAKKRAERRTRLGLPPEE